MTEEKTLFKQINDNIIIVKDLIKKEQWLDLKNTILNINTDMETILTIQQNNLNDKTKELTINLDQYDTVRHVLAIDASFVIGQQFTNDVNWFDVTEFCQLLQIDKECFQNAFLNMSCYTYDERNRIFMMCLQMCQLDNFGMPEAVYIFRYFISYVFKSTYVSHEHKDCTSYFYSHLTSYSPVLLIGCTIAMSKSPFSRRKWFIAGQSKMMTILKTNSNGIKTIISAYLTFIKQEDENVIELIAKGIASPSYYLKEEEMYSLMIPQIVDILNTKDSDYYIWNTVVCLFYFLSKQSPQCAPGYLYPLLLNPLLFLTKQPYCYTISLKEEEYPHLPTSTNEVFLLLRRITRLLSCNIHWDVANDLLCILPPLFHLYVFCYYSKSAYASLLNKIIKQIIQSKPEAIGIFISITKMEGLSNQNVRFVNNEEGYPALRQVDPSNSDDMQWTLNLQQRTSYERELNVMIDCFIINNNTQYLAEFLIGCMNYFYVSQNELTIQAKFNIATIMQKIIDLKIPLFSNNVYSILQVIQHLLSMLVKKDTTVITDEGKLEMFSFCIEILDIINTEGITIPKVMDITIEKDKKNHNVTMKDEENQRHQYSVEIHAKLSAIAELITSLKIDSSLKKRAQYIVNLLLIKSKQTVSDHVSNQMNYLLSEQSIANAYKQIQNSNEAVRAYGIIQLQEAILAYTGDNKTYILSIITKLCTQFLLKDSFDTKAAINCIMLISSKYHFEVAKELITLLQNPLSTALQKLNILECISAIIQYNKETCLPIQLYLNALITLMSKGFLFSWIEVDKKKEIKATSKEEVTIIQIIRASCLTTIADIIKVKPILVKSTYDDLFSICNGILRFEQTPDALEVRRGAAFLVYWITKSGESDHSNWNHYDTTIGLLCQYAENDADAMIRSHINDTIVLYKSYQSFPLFICCKKQS